MKKFIMLLIVVIAFACSPKIIPTTQNNEQVILTEMVLTTNQQQGKQLFESKCANCHDLYKPSDFKPVKWESILKKMQSYAEISNEERELIYEYVSSGK